MADFANIVRIFLFLLGASLQFIMLILMFQRTIHKKRDLIFFLFTVSELGWTLGIFLSLFAGDFYKSNLIENISAKVALFSFSWTFPLMVNTLLYNFSNRYYTFPFKMQYILYIGLYTPIIMFWRSAFKYDNFFIATNYETVENIIGDFIPWACSFLLLAIILTFLSYKKATDEDEKRWLFILTGFLVSMLFLYIACFILKFREIQIVGDYITMIMQMMTFILSSLFGYYLYSYNYIEYFFKKGIIYTVLAILVVTFYTSWLRPLGDAIQEKHGINFRTVEGLMVMGLVFFIDPLKHWLQELFNWIFFKERQYYRKVFSDLSATINRSTYLDLEVLLFEVSKTVSKAMKIKEVAIVLFKKVQETWVIDESTIVIDNSEIEHLINYLELNQIPVLNIYNLGEKELEIQKEMKKIKAFTLIAAYNEKHLVGLITLGKRLIRSQLLTEEEEMLMMLLHQMVIAIENTYLAREKFILERKIYENEKLSSLGRLSASIAHEVKNPLSSIRTITQVTKEDLAPDDPNQEGLDLIIGEVDRLSRVVHQLLRFAHPYSKTMERIILTEVIRDVHLLLKHEAEKNNVTIQYESDKNIEIFSDRDALMEIFFNLISNSIQALCSKNLQNKIENKPSELGIVTIRQNLEYEEKTGNATLVHVYITDNGPGISSQDKEKVFEPFYTTKQSGTGLGLTIVQNRIKKLKGTIELEDNHPGVLFHIQLPIDMAVESKLPENF